MATQDEVEQALLDAIKANAESSAKAGSATVTEATGNAARALAEAWAWLTVPNQPH